MTCDLFPDLAFMMINISKHKKKSRKLGEYNAYSFYPAFDCSAGPFAVRNHEAPVFVFLAIEPNIATMIMQIRP